MQTKIGKIIELSGSPTYDSKLNGVKQPPFVHDPIDMMSSYDYNSKNTEKMNDQLSCSLEFKNSPRNMLKWEESPRKSNKEKEKNLEALRSLFTSIEIMGRNEENLRFTRSNS